MPKAKELTITIEDRPGALGRCFTALAERGINVLAFQSFVEEGESLARVLPDDANAAKAVLRDLGMIFEETDVVTVAVPHRPGGLAHAATLLGAAHINIDYSYCGVQPGKPDPLLVFGVDQIRNAVAALEEIRGEPIK